MSKSSTYVTQDSSNFNDMPSGGILITGNACEPNCQKVLAVNHVRDSSKRMIAELYTPAR